VKPLPLRFVPPKAKSGVVQKLSEEVLIYDPVSHGAHCLTNTVAAIWGLCDGKNNVGDITSRLDNDFHLVVDAKIVLMVLEQLSSAGLLTGQIEPELAQLSRRQAVRWIGEIAALTLPFVVSVIVPTPSEAASCLPNGAPCSRNSDCCSNLCILGRCLLGARKKVP